MKTLSARFGLLSHTKLYYIRQIFSYHTVLSFVKPKSKSQSH